MVGGLDGRGADQVDPAWVGDDEGRPGPQPPREPGSEDRVGVGRIGADDEDDVGDIDRGEVLGARRRPERLPEAVAGGGVTDPGAGVDVVVAEGGPHHLLDDVDLFVRTSGRGDPADRTCAVAGLDVPKTVGDSRDRLLPGDDAPRMVEVLADHRVQHAIGVGGIPEGEAALDARVALVGAAVDGRDHPDDLGAPRHSRVVADLVEHRCIEPREAQHPAEDDVGVHSASLMRVTP